VRKLQSALGYDDQSNRAGSALNSGGDIPHVSAMTSIPCASICIPTYNRAEVLAGTLEHLARLERRDEIEVLVYDDGSDRDLRSVLGDRYPDVTFVRSEDNRGQCHGRNVLSGRARGEILIGLDDDSWFTQPDAVSRILAVFAEHPSAGLLSFRITWADGRCCPPLATDTVYPTDSFIGCGYAIRHHVAERTGYYENSLFRGGEERDLAIRVLDAGYDILQVSNINVYHLETHVTRDEMAIHTYVFRNELLTSVLRFPLAQCATSVPKSLLSHLRFCWRRRWPGAYGKGLADAARLLPWAVRHRRPVRASTVRRFRRLARSRVAEERSPGRGITLLADSATD